MGLHRFLTFVRILRRYRQLLGQPVVGFGAMLLCVIWLAVWQQIETERHAVGRQIAQDTANLALVFEQNVARTSSEIDRLLKFLRQSYERSGFKAEWSSLIKEEYTVNEQIMQISVIDPQGMMIASTAMLHPSKPLNLSDREHFRVHAQSQQDQLFISKPILGRASGKWSVQFTRRFSAADGGFGGVIVVSLDPAHLSRAYGGLDLGEGGGLALIGTDDIIRAGTGIYASALGTGLKEGTQYGDHEYTRDGTGLLTAHVEGRIRRLASRRVSGYPLSVIVAGRGVQHDQGWLRNQRNYIAGATVLSVLVILTVWLVALAAWRWRQKQESLTEQLSQQNVRFDTALANMGAGLCMFDSNEHLVVANSRYAQMYGLKPEQVKPGTPFRDIIESRIALGAYAGSDPEAYMRERLAAVRERHPSTKIQTLPDGRVIAIVHQPMVDGGWVATHEDITEQRRYEARIAYMAHHDALTDLPNRTLLQERLEHALARTLRGQHSLAILMLDLDRFKEINDTLGHAMGDALLKTVAERLRSGLRESATIARLGGDEFAVVDEVNNAVVEATAIAERIQTMLSEPFDLGDHQVVVGASIGIAVAPGDGADPGQLLKNADLALYRAKGDGRGTYRFFEPEMNQMMQARRDLERDLRGALVKGEFELHYQPFIDLQSGVITGCEALLRWHHPERGMVPPTDFIGLAEETGLIASIGEWVMRTACAEAATWPDNIKAAVNLSPAQFKNPNLVQMVFNALTASGLPAHRLELEITESALLQNNAATLATVHQLRALGIRISMDDFGIGYSSLSYLQNFPFDKIKIDRSFINNLSNGSGSVAILKAIISLANSLGVPTIAEGVETQEQLDKVRAAGCSEMQGFLFSRARPAREIARLFLPSPKMVESAA